MWTTDAELRFTASSGGGLTVLGLEAGQTVGMTLFEYFGTTDSSFLPIAAHLRALAGESQGYELEWAGRAFRSRLEPLRSVEGEIVGVAGIAVDVTGERQAAAALRETEDRFRSAFEDAAIGMAIVAPDGRFVRVNRALCELSGYSEDELLGLTVRDLTHPDDWEENRRRIRDVLAGPARTFQMEKRYVGKGGSEVWVLLSASLVRDAGGEPLYFVSEMQDVTGRKRTEEQLREAQKMDAIGQLAGGIAHDFNNLLTAIRGYAELVLARLGDEDPLRGDVDEIAIAADRASSLTRQLLAFGRRQVLQPAVLDPNAVVVDMERMLRRLIGEHIELVTALEPALGCVRADRGQIEQVILNLAVNARDAMHEGGRLTIATSSLELDAAGAQRHPDLAPGRYVVLSASDTGAGIDARTKERVFEPFFTTKEPGKGTGLGLATVYGIVRQSGGQIELESEPGRGATFTVYLPHAGDGAPLPEIGVEPVPASTAGRGIVLLVEDDGQVRRLTHRLLEQEGYTVVAAPNAAGALALSSRGEPIDLVLTDVVMPGMNGPELVELLRRERPGVGVLYMSGYADDQVIGRRELEADALLLEKPFTRELLGRKVREALAAGPGRRSAR